MMHALETAKAALSAIPGLAVVGGEISCKIGLEQNISPASYPMIRIVPTRVTPGKPYGNRTAETLIYFGTPVANASGLEAVYSELFDLEAAIIDVLRDLRGRYVETIMDEDRLDAFKLSVVRCELQAGPTHDAGGAMASQGSSVAGTSAKS
jgi:hypothetical protein